jgi:hypothetical protein
VYNRTHILTTVHRVFWQRFLLTFLAMFVFTIFLFCFSE